MDGLRGKTQQAAIDCIDQLIRVIADALLRRLDSCKELH